MKKEGEVFSILPSAFCLSELTLARFGIDSDRRQPWWWFVSLILGAEERGNQR
jgi:hypothetical protein